MTPTIKDTASKDRDGLDACRGAEDHVAKRPIDRLRPMM